MVSAKAITNDMGKQTEFRRGQIRIQIFFELGKDEGSPACLGKPGSVVSIPDQRKNVAIQHITADQTGMVERPVSPGIHSGQQGSHTWNCIIPGGIISMEDGCTFGKSLKIGAGLAWITIKR